MQLASGNVDMRINTTTKTLLVPAGGDPIQQIIPLNKLTDIGYEIQWSKAGCLVQHGVHGVLDVQMEQGCPTVNNLLGMELMREIEQLEASRVALRKVALGQCSAETSEQQSIVELKKLFPEVPLRLLERVPGRHDWSGHELPFNRRRRRQIEQAKTVVVHLFAGKEDPRWKNEEGNGTVVVCLDILGGCDLLHNQHLAGWLEDLAKRGKVDCWLSGPPCRTVSALRNDRDGSPPVLRGRLQERFGLSTLTSSQQDYVDGDTILWLRSLWWMSLSEASGKKAEYMMEQPLDPEEWMARENQPKLGCPSYMCWRESTEVFARLGLRIIRMEQGALGHLTPKPTMLASNIPEVIALENLKADSYDPMAWDIPLQQRLQKSKDLASWAPGLKNILCGVIRRLHRGEPGIRVLSLKERQEIQAWQDHHRAGHLPHRKDCPTCLLAAGRDRQHRRQPCPTSYTLLSLDIMGPFCPGQDQQGQGFRYGLIGVYTVPVDGEGAPLPEGLSELRVKCGHHSKDEELDDECLEAGEQEEGQDGRADQLLQEEAEEEDEIPEALVRQQEVLEKKWKEFIKDRRSMPVRNLTFGVPIRSREAGEVLSGVATIYSKMRAMQLPITRLHTDRAKEFSSHRFQRWTQDRDIHHTMCSGDSPQENARAEKEVGVVKSQMRRMILASGATTSFWPLAFRQSVEQRHRAQLHRFGILLPELLPFGATAVVRRKEWHHRADPFRWPMMKVRLWGPAGDMAASSQGYFVQSEDGKFLRSTVVVIPSKMALQGDLQQSLDEGGQQEDSGALHQGQDGARQEDSPGSLPGGEEPQERQGDGVLFELKNETGDGQVAHDLEELQALKELAQKAQSGIEGLADVFSGGCLQEEPRREVLEVVPHDLPRRRHRKKGPPGAASRQPMVLKFNTKSGREASNNWCGDSCPVADQSWFEMERWEQVMLKQHVGLRRWAAEVADMVSGGIATHEELQSVKDSKEEIRVLETMLEEVAVRSIQEVGSNQVLQTRLVAMDEVRRDMKNWKQAFAEEVEALTSTALEPIDEEKFNQLLAGPMEVECLPMRGVASLKPPCRRKARIVVCGNYASEKEDEALDNSVSGVDSVCIRTFINAAVQYNWTAGSIDVSKAFLQAPRRTATKRITIGMPPKIVTDMELVPKGQKWIIHQALYGLTESPGDWSAHRDAELSVLEWSMENDIYKLEKTPERNVWRIKKKVADDGDGPPLGFLLTYVDDMLILGGDQLVKSTAGAIGRRWQCSALEYLQENAPMRFCGFELTKVEQGIRLDQFGYTQELLKKYSVEGAESCPLPKRQMRKPLRKPSRLKI